MKPLRDDETRERRTYSFGTVMKIAVAVGLVLGLSDGTYVWHASAAPQGSSLATPVCSTACAQGSLQAWFGAPFLRSVAGLCDGVR